MHSHLGTGDHKGITHIIARIAHIHKLNSLKPAQMFSDSEQIRQHLGRVILICKSVPYRNSCIMSQLLYNLLSKASVLNTVVHPAQNSGCICNTLLFSDLRAGWIQISGTHSQIMGCHLKGTAGSGTGLFKDQRHIFSL